MKINILKIMILLIFSLTNFSYAADLPCTATTKIDIKNIQPKIVIVGELHGTNEIPEFVGELACSFIKAGKKLILGLEIPTDTQEAINTYMSSQGTPFDKEKLIESEFGARQDGRSSRAMLELVESMRKIRAIGKDLAVMGFDISVGNLLPPLHPGEKIWKGERNMAMARNIESRARVYPEHTFLILTGATHAYKKKGAPWDAEHEAMAYLLSQRLPTYIIAVSSPGGTGWFCPTLDATGKAQCGSHPIGVRLNLKYQLENAAFDMIDERVLVEETTASPPLRDQ